MSLPSTGAAPPVDSPHTGLPAVRPSPPYGPLLPTALPSYISPHHMDRLTANGLLKAKAIEELRFLDSREFCIPSRFQMPIFKNDPLRREPSSGFNLLFRCEQSHLAISVTEMDLGGFPDGPVAKTQCRWPRCSHCAGNSILRAAAKRPCMLQLKTESSLVQQGRLHAPATKTAWGN